MKRWLVCILVAGLLFTFPFSSFAQEEDEDFGEEMEEDAGQGADSLSDEAISEEELDAFDESEPEESPVASRGVVTYWGDEELNEVEKGFFINGRLGLNTYLTGDITDDTKNNGLGFMFGFGLGYDVMKRLLSLELDVLTSFHNADVIGDDMGGIRDDAKISGDIQLLRTQLALNIKYFTTKRWELYVAPTGGITYSPRNVAKDANGDPLIDEDFPELDYQAGLRLGFEYYTGLRHFSIGLDLEVDYYIQLAAVGMHVAPMLKYTF